MTLVFLDSFDDRSSAKAVAKYSAYNGTPTLTTGRYGQAMTMSNSTAYVSRAFAAKSTWIVGFALQATGLIETSVAFYNTGTLIGKFVVGVGGIIRYDVGSSTKAAASEPILRDGATWYYVELKVVLASTAIGSVHIKINGKQVAAATNVITSTGGDIANEIRWLLNVNCKMADLYVCNGDGTVNNDFLGDGRVCCLRPTGAGNQEAWTPNTGAAWDAINDKVADAPCPDGDTTYIESSNGGDSGDIGTSVYEDLPVTSGTIKGIQRGFYAEKTDAGTRTIRPVVRYGGADHEVSAGDVNPGSGYSYLLEIEEKDPDNAAWTIAGVNGSEFGRRLVA